MSVREQADTRIQSLQVAGCGTCTISTKYGTTIKSKGTESFTLPDITELEGRQCPIILDRWFFFFLTRF